MEQEILNIIGPSKAAMKCIEEYDNEWKANFRWLEELLEEVKSTQTNPKQLFTTTKKRKRKNSSLLTRKIKKNSSSSSSIKHSLPKCSKGSKTDDVSVVRKSKRIASKTEIIQTETECVCPSNVLNKENQILEENENYNESNTSMNILEKDKDLDHEGNQTSNNDNSDVKNNVCLEKDESEFRLNITSSEATNSLAEVTLEQKTKELSESSNVTNLSNKISVTPKSFTSISTEKECSSESCNAASVSSAICTTPVISTTSTENKISTDSNDKSLSIGINATPTTSVTICAKKKRSNHFGYLSKHSSGYLKRTPQPGLLCASQKSLIARVKSIKQMTPKIRDRSAEEEHKKRQKREEEVIQKKYNLLNMKSEEQKRKREERMRRAIEMRQKLEQEKELKRTLEMTKEERSAKNETELKQRQREIIKRKQLVQKQRRAEVEKRRKEEEKNRLLKLRDQTPCKPKFHQKLIPNECASKEIEMKNDKEVSNEEMAAALDATYIKNENENENENIKSNVEEKVCSSSSSSDDSDIYDDYDINDLKSDDDTDNESAPRKKIPSWAQGPQLRAALLQQYHNPPDIHAIFGRIEFPDLTEIFPKQKIPFQKRTSSAEWFYY
ncbi:histone-lysine N-methyltransferase, H3 lysine-79 specific-like [Centruroides vittatus]|uniref:histone-lysine N-methyltransferase, H3 lysine-79 specific-like n=1 Tax=Centruroides vittatus TaxID=120091 RepID=UPI00350F7E4D